MIEGVDVVNSLQEAINSCSTNENAFIIGGAEIYNQAMPYASIIHLTKVHKEYKADTFFPEIDTKEWKEIDSVTYQADEKNSVAYTFSTLERI